MYNCQLSVIERCSPERGYASRSFTAYIYVGDSYTAASMQCSCLNFITSGFIGNFFFKTRYSILEKNY